MNRQAMLDQIRDEQQIWDIIIIGGGATGLGAAVDAASRGFKVVLVEQHDFAKGTSSRSTKLVHGGVRYLQQGNIKLVFEALHERGLLLQNAPHLVKNLSFVVPNYKWWEGPFYGVGLKLYDVMAGKLGLGPSEWLSKEETLQHIPTLDPEGLRGGVIYHDGQFDDARLAINLAQTAVEKGAAVINYLKVISLEKTGEKITGVVVKDHWSGQESVLHGKAVINATGVFTDAILQMDNAKASNLITPSQGVHLVVDKDFLPGKSAIMVPHTDDGRVLFAVPWYDKVVVGTTDTPVQNPSLEPLALEEEISFILKHVARYLTKDPTRKDVKSVFAGLRPLVKTEDSKNTAAISRDHTILRSASGLITITGGKWTTYRKMAEEVIDLAVKVNGFPERACVTQNMPIHGWTKQIDQSDPLHYYGADAAGVRQIASQQGCDALLHLALPYQKAAVIWAVRHEMAQTVEDILARRTRALFLDAQASIAAAPVVAQLMAAEMNRDQDWQNQQVAAFEKTAQNYLLHPA